jgi:hypothetical protein
MIREHVNSCDTSLLVLDRFTGVRHSFAKARILRLGRMFIRYPPIPVIVMHNDSPIMLEFVIVNAYSLALGTFSTLLDSEKAS